MSAHHCSGCECSSFDEEIESLRSQKSELENKVLRLQNHIIGQDKRIAEMSREEPKEQK